jgi:flagellar hook-associated protein 1 FlgK
LGVNNNNATHLYDIVFANDPTKAINDSITGGQLAGLLQIRDTTIPAYIDELNQTATSIINKVNSQHMQGYDQDGNSGGYFFTPTDEAKDMEVNSEIVNDTTKIAASATVNNDGDNAQAIMALQDDNMFASLGTINPPPTATSSVIGSGTGLVANDHIVLTRGATAGTWAVTTQANYPGMVVTAANANSVTISADGTNDAITLSLSGTWESGDTAAFDITAAGPTVGAVTVTDTGNNTATCVINNVGQVYKNTTTGHPIVLTRGATAAASDWTVTDNGGYAALKVLSTDNNSVTLDLNGNGTSDITINLSGTWQQNDILSFALTKNEDTTTIGGYYDAFMSKVGQDVSASSLTQNRQNTILNQYTDQRNQLSGVSLDEEMLNLVKYQMAYSAAGRLISTIQDMMGTLINLGTAGIAIT